MPKMSVPNESLKAKPPVPDGIYDVRLEGFEPKKSSKGDSINLNPILKIVNHPEHDGRQIYDNLNSKAGFIHQDFVHAFGEVMEVNGDSSSIPGDFQGKEDDPATWQYVGPLVGKVAKIQVVQTTYNNKPNNKVNMWICAVQDCAVKFPDIKHSQNLAS